MSNDPLSKEQLLPVAYGTIEATGLEWRLSAAQRATSADLRSIAALLVEAAGRLEKNPDGWLDKWMAL